MQLDQRKTSRRSERELRAGFSPSAVQEISTALNAAFADRYALYVNTRNFHWRMSGPQFRAYHLLLDEQGEQIFAVADGNAERLRKIGGRTLRSVGQIAPCSAFSGRKTNQGRQS